MTDRHLTDRQIAVALRTHLPAHAEPALYGRVRQAVDGIPQRRRIPSVLGVLSGADPVGRRRLVLIAAALLLALAVAVGAATGAWRLFLRDPIPHLDLTPPKDVPALVLSTYDRMPDIPALALKTLRDDGAAGRILVDGSGAVRIERYASQASVEPDTYSILSGTSMGQLAALGADRVWVEQQDAIFEDPRVFLLAELEGAGAGNGPGCGATRNEGEVGNGTAAAGWTYLGAESVLGRPTYHVTCAGGDLWIDAETRLILRSRGPARDDAFQPIPGSLRTIEVTALEFAAQPPALFLLAPPAGVAQLSPDDYRCRLDPAACPAPQSPAPSPATDRGSMPPPPPTGLANGWIAYTSDSRLPGVTDDATGSDLYLVREGVEPILIAGRQGGTVRNVCPSFSPDGTKLAYGVGSSASRAVVVREMDDGGVVGDPIRIAIAGPGSAACPRWSTDGTRIAYVEGQDVVVRGLDGSTRHGTGDDPRLEDFELEPADVPPLISPSEDRSARLEAGTCHIVIATLDGTATRVVAPPDLCAYAIATWSPDGRRLLLMQDVSGHDFTMYSIAAEGPGDIVVVVSEVRTNGARSWPGRGDVSWQAVAP